MMKIMKNSVVYLTVLAMVLFVACSPMEPSEQIPDESSDLEPSLKTFVVEGSDFKFFIDGIQNPDMIVNLGDIVRIELTTTDAMLHDWVVDEFGATEMVRSSDGVTVLEFTANQTGTFEYYCSVGSHREQGMFGNFIVE